MTRLSPGDRQASLSSSPLPGLVALCILLAVAVVGAGCTRSSKAAASSTAAREATLRQIASEYQRDGDLTRAQTQLDQLGLANPGQLLILLAEEDINAGRAEAEIEPLARLASDLGVESPRLMAYLAPTLAPITTPPPPTATPLPPSPTALPTATATETETPEPPTATPEPPTATPTEVPQKPRVVADGTVNLRSGPGRAFPVVGRLAAGQEVEILARNSNGDWWQLAWEEQAWVAGTVVQVLGPIDTVTIAENIPTPPPQPTAAPQPTAPPAAPPPSAGPDFRLESIHLWGVAENGGYYDGTSVHCGEKRELHVVVLDAGGNRLNGVTVKVAYGNQEEFVTGAKGPGEAEFVLGLGQDVYVIRDTDGRQVTSDYARGLSTNPAAIPAEVLMGAGYCRDATDCSHFVSQNGCSGHYSWTATFRRAY